VSDDPTRGTDPERFPWRGLLLGVVLIAPTTLFRVYAYIVAQATLWGQTSLLRGPVFLLFFVVLGNLAVRRVAPRWGLDERDLLLFYAVQCVSTALSGIGWSQFVVPTLGAPHYWATPENGFKTIWEHVPRGWSMTDPAAINALYRGHSSLYQAANFNAVWRPALHWSVFMILLATALWCLGQLLREQWVARERLTFPLSYLPIEMTRQAAGASLWRNRLMWAGFLVVALIDSTNALHFLIPAVPEITVKPVGALLIDKTWTERPLSGMRPFVLSFYPFMIGIGFLLSTDVSFSCWAWYLLIKLVSVAGVQFALCDSPLQVGGFPYLPEQSVGAFAALAALALWRSRADVRGTLRRCRGDDGVAVNRAALGGLLLSGALILAFVTRVGLPPWVGAGWLIIYLAYSLGCARIVSETGSGWTWAPRLTPHDVLTRLPGAPVLNPRQATIFAWLMPFDLDFRDNALPQQILAMKLLPDDGGRRRPLQIGLALALVLGVVAAMWAHLHVYFQYGIDTAMTRGWPRDVGRQPFDLLLAGLRGRARTPYSVGGMGFGAAVLLALVWLRTHFLAWPLHPIGYALALTPSLDYLWCPFLVAWAVKSLVLRYGGMKLYRQLMPFFLGMILGDYVVPLLWALYGTLTSQQMYLSFPH
jgi:hypothetical protein